jgi:asparagine synthase (glutamine-hydrolysing)
MCGIAGFYAYTDAGALSKSDLDNMVATMDHRGPDDRTAVIMGRIGLGMSRLAIIDPAGSNQPIKNEAGDMWFIFNGEIYNYRELRVELIALGHTFTTHGDGEVVVHGYEEWGDSVFDKLNGMFALALLNTRTNSLLLARDRIGIKPLYYFKDADRFVFASEVKALLASRMVTASVNDAVLESYLTFRYVPAPHTMFSGVRKLNPGEFIVLKNGGEKMNSFYSLGFLPKHELSEEEIQNELRDRIDESISFRLRSDAPLGVFLSGGLDSGFILDTVRKHVTGELNSYTVGFDRGGKYNEIGASRVMSKRYGTIPNELEMDYRCYIEALPRAVYFMEEPMADPSSVPMMELSTLAKQRVRVILSGEGGDELFSGYPRYIGESLATLPGFLPTLGSLAGRFFRPFLSRSLQRGLNGLGVRNGPRRHLLWETIISPDLRRRLLTGNRPADSMNPLDIIEQAARRCDSSDEQDRLTNVDIRLWLVEDLLLKKDKMGMSASIEARVPYLDHGVVDFACRLDPRMKVRNLTGKYIFKQLLKRSLPAEILNRPKVGFAVPLNDWFREELSGCVKHILCDNNKFLQEYLSQDGLRHLVDRHRSGRDLSLELFTLIFLELWGRIFILGESHQELSKEISRAV